MPEQRAIDLVRSMGTGVVLTLLQQPEDERDVQLSTAALCIDDDMVEVSWLIDETKPLLSSFSAR